MIKVKKTVLYILPRLLVSFAVVLGTGYIFFVQPKQAAQNTIRSHIQETRNLSQALQNSRERLKTLSQPQTIVPGKPGARAYANQLNDAKGAFGADQPKVPKILENKTQDKRVSQFNQVITDKDYQNSLADASRILAFNRDFLSHQAAVMKALANLLEYDPAVDMAAGMKEEELQARLQATQAGLERTLQRLDQVRHYTSDKSLYQVTVLVDKLQKEQIRLTENMTNPEFSKRKQDFIDLVRTTQIQIIENRDIFWVSEKQRRLEETNRNINKLEIFMVKLEKIND